MKKTITELFKGKVKRGKLTHPCRFVLNHRKTCFFFICHVDTLSVFIFLWVSLETCNETWKNDSPYPVRTKNDGKSHGWLIWILILRIRIRISPGLNTKCKKWVWDLLLLGVDKRVSLHMEGWDNKDTESQGTYLIRQRM